MIKKRYVCIGLIVFLFGLVMLPIFPLKEITISNTLNFCDEFECNKSLEKLKDKNIFKVYIFKSIQKALNNYNNIQDINVSFSGITCLKIHIEEKKPWISTIIEGESFFIDRDGQLLQIYNNEHNVNVNSIFIVKGLDITNFKHNVVNSILLRKLQHYEAIFKDYFPNKTLLLDQVYSNSWELLLDDSIRVQLGSLDFLENKFKRICYVIENDKKNNDNISVIDARINKKLLVVYGK